MHGLRLAITTLVALALVATACRAEGTIDASDRAPATATTPAAVSPSPPPEGAPTPAPNQTNSDESDPAPRPVPAGGDAVRFEGAAPATPAVPPEWNEPFALDPDVTQGVLPNGLTYLVRRNDRPGSQAQLRLVVHAGSLNEAEGTFGTAHFLEHMMFNGTERFPGNEIVQVLEGFGSGFGPDVNAYTSFEETVYELQVPTRSTESLQLGLDVLHQWATAATIDLDAVIAERGVVREEHRRAVEPLSGRIGRQIREVLFDGTDYLGRDAIGDVDVIESMTDQELRDYYERWYRPELMTVIAVGDFNVGDVEQRIAATFVQPASAELTQPLALTPAPDSLTEPVFDVITDDEIQRPTIEVLWRRSRDQITSQAALRSELVAGISLSMLNNRLFERVQGSDSVLSSANANAGVFTNSTRLVSLSGAASAEDTDAALIELLTEIERARQFGFSPAELERELAVARASAEQTFAESDTIQDGQYAAELVAFALGSQIAPDAVQQLATSNQVLDSITVEDVEAFLFETLTSEPYVLLTGPAQDESVLPSPEELADTYYRIVGNVVDQEAREADERAELLARPEPAEIVDRANLGALETTVVTYENGARLAFRQTQVTENVVQLRAVSPGGFFAIDGPQVPLLDRGARLVAGSGFETVDIVSLDRLLSGSIVSLSTSIGRAEESLTGEASTADVETLFQLIHLQMTEPTITDLQVRQFNERWRPLAEDPAANPQIAGDLELWRLRYGDSPWFRLIPTTADLDGLDPIGLLDAYRDRFADAGDFVFHVVGDFDPDELVDLGARYLGTLPDSGRREEPIDRDPGVPQENLVATVAAGIGDQGRVRINWESPYPFTLEAAVAAQAVELVVNARLRDLIREQLGASYAPNAAVAVLSEPKSWVDTIIEVESDPDRVEEVSRAVRDELDRIRAGDLDEQYLRLAVEQLTEGYRFFSNNDWLQLMEFHVRYPDRPANEYRSRSDIAEQLTTADIADAATVIFPANRSVEVWLVPAE